MPSITETVLEPALAPARSGLPSPFRSPTATELGLPPVSNERNGAVKSGAASARGAVMANPTASKSPGISRNSRVDLGVSMGGLQRDGNSEPDSVATIEPRPPCRESTPGGFAPASPTFPPHRHPVQHDRRIGMRPGLCAKLLLPPRHAPFQVDAAQAEADAALCGGDERALVRSGARPKQRS